MRPSEHIKVSYNSVDADLRIRISGRWTDIILYEIPLLSLISEAYFRFIDKEWDHIGQYERAFCKAERLIRGGCKFAEFGTRRRRDYETHDAVIRGLRDAHQALKTMTWENLGGFNGTSNVHFAMKYNLVPVGTVAHEL